MQPFNYASLHVSSCFLMTEFQFTGSCEIVDDPVINCLETSSETAGTLNLKCVVNMRRSITFGKRSTRAAMLNLLKGCHKNNGLL